MKTLGTHNYYVYILTNFNKTVLYTGLTNNLKARLEFHKQSNSGFTAKYKCFYLLYFEHHNNVNQAIKREKQIKGYSRKKKENLINAKNPFWQFLNDKI